MNIIKRSGTDFEISNYPWSENGYTPKTTVNISYDDDNFYFHFVAYETEILYKRTVNNTDIHNDSCMELFMQFDTNDPRYVNIEINPIGTVFNAIRTGRNDPDIIMVSDEDIKKLNIKAEIFSDRWELKYTVPVNYIKKFIPTYVHKTGAVIKGNLYKCGDEMKFPHFGCFNLVGTKEPDFHRPEYFCEFILD